MISPPAIFAREIKSQKGLPPGAMADNVGVNRRGNFNATAGRCGVQSGQLD
jgi:hypothetical protein